MPARTANIGRKRNQRPKRTPPHVPVHILRKALGLSLEAATKRIGEVSGKEAPSKGSLSAVETGMRGASAELIAAMEEAYGLDPGTITTDYLPRATAKKDTE